MYIEFSLNPDIDHVNRIVTRALHEWSDRYNIPYNVKNIKYTKRITFDDDTHYSLFAMTWNPDKKYHALSRWRIVSDLNNKTTFDFAV
jgi:hypothetical protein